MDKKKLSVIVPAYNEETRIYNTIKKIINYLKRNNYSFEIVVVNDGSTDNTLKIVRKIKNREVKIVSYSKNRGKGYAVRKGMLAARNKLALFCDADLSTPIEELDNFIKFIDEYDIIVGSRVIKGYKILKKQPFYRVFLGRIFSRITKFLLPIDVQDTQCGFKLLKNYKQLFRKQTTEGFAFDVELLFLAKKQGLKILELPIIWRNAEGSKLNPIKDSWRMFCEVAKIKLNSIKRAY